VDDDGHDARDRRRRREFPGARLAVWAPERPSGSIQAWIRAPARAGRPRSRRRIAGTRPPR
jgi:hypothetical protein